MSGSYTFLPWLRHGLATRLGGAPATGARASMQVELELLASPLGGGTPLPHPITQPVELYGPGDIIGVDRRAIVRTEPRDWITDFEPNYLAAIEFYDEDFPWRYTPEAPTSTPPSRLSPWIALVVLAEGEFEDRADPGRPLPAFELKRPAAMPAAVDLWAWAHVHVNRSLLPSGAQVVSDDMDAVLPALAATLGENADLAYSRIVCPRRLAENGAYHAFLVPVFESGRLAGLNLDPAGTPTATHSAWADYTGRPESPIYPYYHRWYFRTGAIGDFEYLVRLLRPKPVDPRVGVRDVDVLAPGSNLPSIDDPDLGGVLALGGALRVPREALDEASRAERDRREAWSDPYPHRFQTALARLVSLADDYAANEPASANAATGIPYVEDDPDPLIVPPLYGRWHSLTGRLLTDRDGTPLDPDSNWVHELNLDPRHRLAAGFGTRVVQDGQERYMDAAWAQVGDVLEANRRLRAAQLAREVTAVWHTRHLSALATERPGSAVLVAAPALARVMAGEVTAAHMVAQSSMPAAPLSAAARRLARPGGRVARHLELARPDAGSQLVERLADEQITAAPPRATPAGATTLDEAAEAAAPDLPAWLADLLRRAPWLRFVPALVLLVLVPLLLIGSVVAIVAGVIVAAAFAGISLLLSRALSSLRRATLLGDAGQTVAGVAALPHSPDFTLSRAGEGVTPRAGATDSPEAARFRAALADGARLQEAAAEVAAEPVRAQLDVPALVAALTAGLNPDQTIARRVLSALDLPERIAEVVTEQLIEAMAYPEIDTPMYRPLVDISAELFLPNLGLIEPDSITLLETDQRFIEAYLAGLNHEFARELLWREYPTDQRGTCFRQFWDVSSYLTAGDDEALRERLRDIPPLHRWTRRSQLGGHDHRQAGGGARDEVVLVIRGQLLKKYPNAVIYAHRADWRRVGGVIDRSQERALVDILDGAIPSQEVARTPLYEARVDPDIAFFGFDLTAVEARGETAEAPDDPGWFFVIKERPGEPRFGFDVDRSGPLEVWNDLAWPDVLPSGEQIDVGTPAPPLTAPTEPEKGPQHADDVHVAWGPSMTAADAAYVLYQAPVLVAVHAAEMLTPRTSDGAGLPRP